MTSKEFSDTATNIAAVSFIGAVATCIVSIWTWDWRWFATGAVVFLFLWILSIGAILNLKDEERDSA